MLSYCKCQKLSGLFLIIKKKIFCTGTSTFVLNLEMKHKIRPLSISLVYYSFNNKLLNNTIRINIFHEHDFYYYIHDYIILPTLNE